MTVNQSTRDLAAILVNHTDARKPLNRDTLFQYGAELALIASLMCANVSQAVDLATAEIRGEQPA